MDDFGFVEPYKEGFLEIHPDDEEELGCWLIAALHMPDGEMFVPSPRVYSKQALALEEAGKLFDWIVAHTKELHLWGAFSPDRNTLKRSWDKYERSPLPYYIYIDDGTLVVSCPSDEAKKAGWMEAVDLSLSLYDFY